MNVFRRGFFKCVECRFKFSLLGGQNHYEIDGCCSSCGGDVDYMSKNEMEDYINELKEELKYF